MILYGTHQSLKKDAAKYLQPEICWNLIKKDGRIHPASVPATSNLERNWENSMSNTSWTRMVYWWKCGKELAPMEKLRKIYFYHHNEDLSCCYESVVPVCRAKDAKCRDTVNLNCISFQCTSLCVDFYHGVLPHRAPATICHWTFGSISYPVSPNTDSTPKLIVPSTSTPSCHPGAQKYTWFSTWDHRLMTINLKGGILSQPNPKRSPTPPYSACHRCNTHPVHALLFG